MKRWKRVLAAMGILATLLGAVSGITGCGRTPRYNVDYCGSKASFKNAKDSYPAGAKVTLIFPGIATDTSYTFYVDGEEVRYDYSERKGIILTFVMPDHDITVDYHISNQMIDE